MEGGKKKKKGELEVGPGFLSIPKTVLRTKCQESLPFQYLQTSCPANIYAGNQIASGHFKQNVGQDLFSK